VEEEYELGRREAVIITNARMRECKREYSTLLNAKYIRQRAGKDEK